MGPRSRCGASFSSPRGGQQIAYPGHHFIGDLPQLQRRGFGQARGERSPGRSHSDEDTPPDLPAADRFTVVGTAAKRADVPLRDVHGQWLDRGAAPKCQTSCTRLASEQLATVAQSTLRINQERSAALKAPGSQLEGFLGLARRQWDLARSREHTPHHRKKETLPLDQRVSRSDSSPMMIGSDTRAWLETRIVARCRTCSFPSTTIRRTNKSR